MIRIDRNSLLTELLVGKGFTLCKCKITSNWVFVGKELSGKSPTSGKLLSRELTSSRPPFASKNYGRVSDIN